MNKKILLIAVFLVSLGIILYGTKKNHLTSPYPFLPAMTHKVSSNVQCPPTPVPIHDMKYTSIYTDRSHGISIVDKAAQKQYKQQIAPLKKYEQQLYKWLEDAYTKPEKFDYAVSCSLDWLSSWAKENALLDGQTNFQGEAVRKWTLAALSSLYVQIKDIKGTNKNQKQQIERWLSQLAAQVISDYEQHPDSISRNNNHLYWAGWSVMITGVAVNNQDYYEWGLKQYKKGAEAIQQDGTLPLETARQGRAFLYHIFAAAPLVMMAETATRNGKNMYQYNNSAISRLVQLIVKELDNNQAYITKFTGVQQNLEGVITPANLAWLEVYQALFPSDEIEKWTATMRPMEQRRIGGDMTRLFGATQEKNKGK